MGREAVAVCHWQGDVAEARLHLDSQALSLRGEMRVDIPRADIRDVVLADDGVRVLTNGPELLMEFAAVEAARWQKALLKKPPTLAEKLGVSVQSPGFVLGDYDDAVLADVLHGVVVSDVTAAALLLAVVMDENGLVAASDLALTVADKHIWMLYRKGKAAVVGDKAVRAHMRGLGFIDSKSCAVSDQLTATRYRLRAR